MTWELVVGETYLYTQPAWGCVVVFEGYVPPNGARIRWEDGPSQAAFCVPVEYLRPRPMRFERADPVEGGGARGVLTEYAQLGGTYLLHGAQPVQVMQYIDWPRVRVDYVEGAHSVSLVVDVRDLVHPNRTRFARALEDV